MIKFIKEKFNKSLNKLMTIRKNYRDFRKSHRFINILFTILEIVWTFFDLILTIKEERMGLT